MDVEASSRGVLSSACCSGCRRQGGEPLRLYSRFTVKILTRLATSRAKPCVGSDRGRLRSEAGNGSEARSSSRGTSVRCVAKMRQTRLRSVSFIHPEGLLPLLAHMRFHTKQLVNRYWVEWHRRCFIRGTEWATRRPSGAGFSRGIGLHSGEPVKLTLSPAARHGILFRAADGTLIPATSTMS